jgi:hypothetical protein
MQSILSSSQQRLAIIGLAKNVGKTTTLNWVIEEGDRLGHRVGVASIGVDGENQDVWNFHHKPAIKINKGMWAASAKAALSDSTARFRIVEELKQNSPLGPVYLLECIQGGQVKLAGTYTIDDIMNVHERFSSQGVSLSLVDGAYDRLASAQDKVAGGCLLCTGAALDPHLESALRKTEELLVRWQLPIWKPTAELTAGTKLIFHDKGREARYTLSEHEGKVVYSREGEWFPLESPSLLAVLDQVRLLVAEGIDYLLIPGALTEWIMQHFIQCKKPFAWIIDDPTKLFITHDTLLRWLRVGGEVYVRGKSQLLALSVNPFSEQGEQDADEWLYRMKEIAGDLPVIDAMRRKRI